VLPRHVKEDTVVSFLLSIWLARTDADWQKAGRKMSAPLINAARELRTAVAALKFSAPVSHVYNPLDYAWLAHESYLKKFGRGSKRVLFLGMNPGPFGMAQTGVPFGEIAAVRDWLGIQTDVGKPRKEHPKRPIQGFACERSEVSGQRLWGMFAARFVRADDFFADHFVANYCPLAFLEKSGRNLTPDKLPARQSARLYAACDAHLRRVVEILKPEWLVGVGDYAQQRAVSLFADASVKIGKILHPSPASPAANRGWANQAERQLKAMGVW
jgi:single-strand selective monofunctional uracil DNA glycosylase